MKNRVLIFFFLISIFPLYAKDLSLKIEPLGVQFKKGCYKEFVFSYDEHTNQYERLSELDWNIDKIFYLTSGFNVKYKKLSLDTFFYSGWDQRSGVMYDSDWQTLNQNLKTNFSINENTLNNCYGFDVNLLYDISLAKNISIAPLLGLTYEYIDFSACNGIGWYGDATYSKTGKNVSWDSPDAKEYKLLGIDYIRQNMCIHLGLSSDIIFSFFTLSPYLKGGIYTKTTSQDTHHGKSYKTFYLDFMDNYFSSVNTGIKASAKCTDIMSISLSLDYLYQALSEGPSYGYKEIEEGGGIITTGLSRIVDDNRNPIKAECSANCFTANLGLVFNF